MGGDHAICRTPGVVDLAAASWPVVLGGVVVRSRLRPHHRVALRDRIRGHCQHGVKGDVPHLRMEHWTEPSESAIRKSAEKGLAVATQPIFLYAEIESYLTNLGVERMKKTYPIQDLLKAGVPFCFSTDAPATSWAVPSDPFPCLKGGVTRTAWDGTDCGPDNRVDIKTAIQLYTREGARVAGIPEIGELKAGYHADFITLSEDILSVDPMKIDQVYVTATYVDGEKVYESEAKS